jgi:xanthine dehydrogenase YagS FAD-binding subunit
MAVALVALDAQVHLQTPDGPREIALEDLLRLPGDTPHLETTMPLASLITAIEIPPLTFGRHSTYRKVRDRASYAFAVVSVAAALDLDENGKVRDVRLAFGGVAPKPWRARVAENSLRGNEVTVEALRAAADSELAAAEPLPGNAYKVELLADLVVDTLGSLARGRL